MFHATMCISKNYFGSNYQENIVASEKLMTFISIDNLKFNVELCFIFLLNQEKHYQIYECILVKYFHDFLD